MTFSKLTPDHSGTNHREQKKTRTRRKRWCRDVSPDPQTVWTRDIRLNNLPNLSFLNLVNALIGPPGRNSYGIIGWCQNVQVKNTILLIQRPAG